MSKRIIVSNSMKVFTITILLIGLLLQNIAFTPNNMKPYCIKNNNKRTNAAANSSCDPASLNNYYPYVNTDMKNYYLQFLVKTDSSGNAIGGITIADIDFLMANVKNILNPIMFDFCYSVDFSNSVVEDSLPFKEQITYVYIRDCPSMGVSGNPICLDYVAVMDSASFGGNVLAHELGHNFQLPHVGDANNLMYPSTGGGYYLADTQIARMHCYAEQVHYLENNIYGYPTWLSFGEEVCLKQWVPYNRFFSNMNGGCVPLTVSFQDSSSFSPISWFWNFGDGFTDTVPNPSHTYTQAGIYTVTMITSNGYGSDTLIKINEIVAPDTILNLPFYEDFEDTLFAPPFWYVRNPDQTLTWTRNTKARGNGNSQVACMIDNISGDFYDYDKLVTPRYNLQYVFNPYLTFNISIPQDGLKNRFNVYISTDCGKTYDLIYSKTNDTSDSKFILGTLSWTQVSDSYFTPSDSSYWRMDTIKLNSYSGASSVNFMFEYRDDPYLGSTYLFYLDDIFISADKISGLPVADFKADTTTIYQNDTVNFTNLSAFSDTLQWFFTGATIASTQDTNPSIVYDSAGIFPVTLVVWNLFGRDTLTKLAYINVLQKIIDTIPCDSMKIILSKNDLSCKDTNDGTVTVSAFNGNSDYSFSWSNGSTLKAITGLAEGTYTITVTDSIGCIKTDSVKISYIDSLPAADFSYADTGYAVNFTNLSANADSYLWNFGDDSTDNSSNPNHIYFDFGTYEACLIAMNNCGADTLCKSISIIEGIKESTGKINLQIFPNPNSGTFTIIVEQSTASEIQITLTNILGQKIYTNKATTKEFKDELNLTNFGKGIYSLKIVTNNESVSRKVVYR